MTNFPKSQHATKWLPVKQLSVLWADAQRPLDERHVDRIAAAFDPDMFGIISVTQADARGIYHIIDGNHRRHAVLKLFGDSEMVPCNVFDTVDPARAAQIFYEMQQGRKAISAIDNFRVGVTAGYKTQVAIAKIVKSLGFEIKSGADEGSIRSPGACTFVYRKHGGDVLTLTLLTLRTTFGKNAEAFDASLIRGFAAFLAEYGPQIDRQRLTERVSKQYTPARLLGAAKSMREMFRSDMPTGVSKVVLNSYNQGLRNGRLGEAA